MSDWFHNYVKPLHPNGSFVYHLQMFIIYKWAIWFQRSNSISPLHRHFCWLNPPPPPLNPSLKRCVSDVAALIVRHTAVPSDERKAMLDLMGFKSDCMAICDHLCALGWFMVIFVGFLLPWVGIWMDMGPLQLWVRKNNNIMVPPPSIGQNVRWAIWAKTAKTKLLVFRWWMFISPKHGTGGPRRK